MSILELHENCIGFFLVAGGTPISVPLSACSRVHQHTSPLIHLSAKLCLYVGGQGPKALVLISQS
jgi:hypothetical protein